MSANNVTKAIEIDKESDLLEEKRLQVAAAAAEIAKTRAELTLRRSEQEAHLAEEAASIESKRKVHEEAAMALDLERKELNTRAQELLEMGDLLDTVAQEIASRLQQGGFDVAVNPLASLPTPPEVIKATPVKRGPAPVQATSMTPEEMAFMEAWEAAKDFILAGNFGQFGEMIEVVPECINMVDESDGNTYNPLPPPHHL